MVSEFLKKARNYESDADKEFDADNRPLFHLSSRTGWMNDPNGFSFYNGEYHLFYQYHPYNTKWGPMHWGHCTTKDFVHWRYLPAALAPDTAHDDKGCFSGSAIEKDGRHFLLYTGVHGSAAGSRTGVFQEQCLAVGNGSDYEKYGDGPVITTQMIPDGFSEKDFRDPKVFFEKGIYYCAVGARAADGSGAVLLYRSKDLINWSYSHVIAACRGQYGTMWECPDYFVLDNKRVMLVSPQDMLYVKHEFHAGNGTLCVIGRNCGAEEDFERLSAYAIDYGTDFYAPQTVQAADGRRIMTAWMKSWDNDINPDGFDWNGMMIFPRELSVKGDRLFQKPAEEICAYRGKCTEISAELCDEKKIYNALRGRTADMEIELSAIRCSRIVFNIAESEDFRTSIEYMPDTEILSFDRNMSGIRRDAVNTREILAKQDRGRLKLRLLLDRFSAELFVNDGEKVLTSLIFTDASADGFSCEVYGGSAKLKIKHYEIKP